jgi:dienelactone hydrolase
MIMAMRIRTRSIVVAAAVLTVLPLLSGVAAPVSSTARVQLSLPRPTGSDAVGLDTLHLVDASRPDPWVPQSGPRQLMVSMYYPALPLSGRPAAYMSPAEAQALISFAELDDVISAATLAGTRTWARVGASPLPGRYPLVVLSPGFSVPRYELTGLAEDIASKGFVVASIDHAYESTASQFPDGILPCVACDELKAGTVSHEAIALGRARDVSFVIDELVGPGWAWRRAGLIDPVRIGMAGHSIGGDATAATMKSDRRVRAGASLDGPFTPVIPASGLGRRPFLMFGDADAEAPGVDPTWDASWPNLDGWKRWLTVTNGDHYTFTDLNYLVNQSGGLSIPGAERSIKITRAYVAAFFEQSLKTIPRPLLGGPSKAYPEVVFNAPCG